MRENFPVCENGRDVIGPTLSGHLEAESAPTRWSRPQSALGLQNLGVLQRVTEDACRARGRCADGPGHFPVRRFRQPMTEPRFAESRPEIRLRPEDSAIFVILRQPGGHGG